jgi:hypothetical protein
MNPDRDLVQWMHIGDNGTAKDVLNAVYGSVIGGAIRQDWIETVERVNVPLFEEGEGDPKAGFLSVARRLVQALESEKRAAQERVAVLGEILGSGLGSS